MRAWIALAVTLLVPGAAAQQGPVPTDLFVHVIGVMDAPINTQEPPESYSQDAMYGPLSFTVHCLHGTTGDLAGTGLGTAGTTSQAFHTFRAYGTPSPVEYGQLSADGTPRVHPGRGVWGNVTVDTTAPMALHWFLKATYDGALPDPVIPNVIVRAVIRSGDAISVDDRVYDAGRLLFSGEVGPVSLANGEILPTDVPGGTVQAVAKQGDAWVYEFVLPLQAIDPVVRMDEGYNLRVDVLMDTPGCDDPDATVMPAGIATHSSPGLRPRIAWSVLEPMAAGHASMGFKAGEPWLSVQAATVFGAQDATNVTVELVRVARDGSRAPVPLDIQFVQGYGPCGHDCGHLLEARYSPEGGLRAGTYNLTVSWDNLQGTAHRVASAELVVQPAAETPALGPLVVLGLLAGLAAVLRRR